MPYKAGKAIVLLGVCLLFNVYGAQTTTQNTISEIPSDSWIHLTNPTKAEFSELAKATGIDLALFFVPQPGDHPNHLLQEKSDDTPTLLIDTPMIHKTEEKNYEYSVLPLYILIDRHYFITIAAEHTPFIEELWKTPDFAKAQDSFSYLAHLLYANEIRFVSYLQGISKTITRLEPSIGKATTNKELLHILQLSKSLTYFSTAIRSNGLVYESVSQKTYFEVDVFSRALVSTVNANKQAASLSSMQAEVISNVTDIVAAIVSNNLNIVMKFLAAVTIIMGIPSIFSGLFGMNFPWLPFGDSVYGFLIVVGISIVSSVLVAVIFWKKHMF